VTAVAGSFDDLLHDDVIAELKVERKTSATVEHSAKYIGQPTQFGVGRDSQLSVLVDLDHPQAGAARRPRNYIGWMRPKVHGLEIRSTHRSSACLSSTPTCLRHAPGLADVSGWSLRLRRAKPSPNASGLVHSPPADVRLDRASPAD